MSDAIEVRFDAAVHAVIDGDLEALDRALARDPELVRQRGPGPFAATLLHFVAANGVPDELQRSPAEAPQVARRLLEAGSDPDARAGDGGALQTPLCLLASSWHPFERGVQVELVRVLIEGGAAPLGPDGDGAPLTTALTFGYTRAAQALAALGGRDENLLHAAGLGDAEAVRGWFGPSGEPLPNARGRYRPVFARDGAEGSAELVQEALHLAVTHGQLEVAGLLLERGADPNGTSVGHHATLPLLQALFVRERAAVDWLARHGADPERVCAKLGLSAREFAARAPEFTGWLGRG